MRIVTRRVATIKYPANALCALVITLWGGVKRTYNKHFAATCYSERSAESPFPSSSTVGWRSSFLNNQNVGFPRRRLENDRILSAPNGEVSRRDEVEIYKEVLC